MFAVEKILRVVRIARHVGRESRQRRKRRVGQLPAVADQFKNSPAARSGGMRTDRLRRPRGKIEVAMTRARLGIAPGIVRLALVRHRNRPRDDTRLPSAIVCRATSHRRALRRGSHTPASSPLARAAKGRTWRDSTKIALPEPAGRMLLVLQLFPAPIVAPPIARLVIAAGADEFEEFAVGHRQAVDVKRRHIDGDLAEFIVPAESDIIETRPQAGFACGNSHAFIRRRPLEWITRQVARARL